MVVCLPYSKHAPASLTVEREKSAELGVLEEHFSFSVSAMMNCLQVILRSNISGNFTLKGPSQQWGLFLKRMERRKTIKINLFVRLVPDITTMRLTELIMTLLFVEANLFTVRFG